MGIAAEEGGGREDACSTQKSLTCLQDVQGVLEIVIRIPSAIETLEVLQED